MLRVEFECCWYKKGKKSSFFRFSIVLVPSLPGIAFRENPTPQTFIALPASLYTMYCNMNTVRSCSYLLIMIGSCGGELACSTCHVVLPKKFYDTLQDKEEEEEDMLDLAWGLTDT